VAIGFIAISSAGIKLISTNTPRSGLREARHLAALKITLINKGETMLDAELIEKYVKLSDMKAGDTAISKDRERFFVCGHHYNFLKKGNELNNLSDQYSDNRDMSEPVLILKRGDKFVCTA
jgi:hypothetical protein